MGSIQSRQAAIGYKTATQRPSCRNCKHGAEVIAEHRAPTEGPRWECARYGFGVTASAICERHVPKLPAGTTSDTQSQNESPRATGRLGAR